ncbi:FGGY family carbohydrate kinase [Alicyclobacillus sp.]|uniref:xylulokinase n=1 Tax=Alicyclobacillus sp. TaxID=61169 RepID=UPI0025C37552|nr:FGGY family carbohydrate kinase [Alicyclobacillus sp.]MCL6517905.1 hypothetical protein [Alicyclobacillus sp.]
MHAKEGVLVVDLGTTVCKAVLFDPLGGILGSGARRMDIQRPQDGAAEQDPESWWAAASSAVRQALAAAPRDAVAAVALCGQRESVVPVDDRMRPLHPALLWMDARGWDLADRWRTRMGARVRAWTGLVPGAPYTAGKIHWWLRHRPDVAARTRWYLQAKDWLVHRLTGEVVTDATLAARTMLYNPFARRWQPELLGDLGVSASRFPTVLASTAWAGGVRPEAAQDWGVAAGTPVLVGGGDRPCEALGLALEAGEVMESSGTTSNVATLADHPRPGHPAVSATPHVLPGRWLWELGLAGTGAVLERLGEWFGGAPLDWRQLDHALARTRPGADGLLALPLLLGARAPRWNRRVRGAIAGLHQGHSAEDWLRAAAEGIAYELRAALDALAAAGAPSRVVRVTGGLSRCAQWNRIKASVYGRPVIQSEVAYGAAFGAFLLAAGRLDWPVEEAVARRRAAVAAVHDPDPAETRLYEAGYALYEALHRQLLPLWPRLEEYRAQSRKIMPQNLTDPHASDEGL